MFDANFDYVILGGGTAGCVLAARLSSNPERSVLLVEAGSDFLPGQEPAAIRSTFPISFAEPSYLWPGLIAEVGPDPGNGQPRSSRLFAQGRCIGGSSSIMGMMATRGLPADYDEWQEHGADGWSWSDVLPFFKRCERDLDFRGPLHGSDGPIPIRRNARGSWPPLCRVFAQVLQERGHAFLEDYNTQFSDGVSAVPMNNLPETRISTAMAYLDAKVRSRRNLRIMADAVVETLECRGRSVSGAVVRTASGRVTVRGRETILCAGALHSPAILMRSGIGRKEVLGGLGLQVIADLPGVGQNLQNHPIVGLAVDLPAGSRQSASLPTWSFSVLRYSSKCEGCPAGDMQIVPLNRTSWHLLGQRIGLIGVCVFKPFSRGEVTLQSADPCTPPTIKMNLLADARDFDRLRDGVGVALSILDDPRIAAIRNEVFLPPSLHANNLHRPTLSNWLKTAAVAGIFGISGAVRRRALRKGLLDVSALFADPDAVRDIVKRTAGPAHHVCGTCKIGRATDPAAVVDSDLRVHGVQGLRVADASVMPTIVSANTHLPVVMIAEKAADLILADANRAAEQGGPAA